MAAALASLVVFAGMGMLFTMNRTDRMLETRAQERAQLSRLRLVMERTFSSLLMSDEPRTGTTAGNRRDISDQLDVGGVTAAQPVAENGRDGASGGAADAANKDKKDKALKPPPPPRIVLSVEAGGRALLHYVPVGEEQAVDASPQRLEVVLHHTPIPQVKVDPMDMPLPPRSRRRTAPSERREAPGIGGAEDGGAAEDGAEELSVEEEAALPVRAVRGAFEMHPQPPRGWRAPGIPQQPADVLDPFVPTGLWELWWMPLPPPGSEDVEVSAREAAYAGAGRPYLVAGDLKYVRFTAFFARGHRQDLVSTWTGDLPAYVELQAETAGGLKANWMFEVDWATGPEVAKRPERADRGGSSVETTSPDGASTTGGSKPGTPSGAQPAQPRKSGTPQRPAKTSTGMNRGAT